MEALRRRGKGVAGDACTISLLPFDAGHELSPALVEAFERAEAGLLDGSSSDAKGDSGGSTGRVLEARAAPRSDGRPGAQQEGGGRD